MLCWLKTVVVSDVEKAHEQVRQCQVPMTSRRVTAQGVAQRSHAD